MMSLARMMRGFATFYGKHRIIANEMSNIIHHIAAGDASLKGHKFYDIITKLEIALKEASETGYWLELLHRTKYNAIVWK